MAFAGTKYLSIAAVALGSVANISFPAISSIKSKSVPRHEQVASPSLSSLVTPSHFASR